MVTLLRDYHILSENLVCQFADIGAKFPTLHLITMWCPEFELLNKYRRTKNRSILKKADYQLIIVGCGQKLPHQFPMYNPLFAMGGHSGSTSTQHKMDEELRQAQKLCPLPDSTILPTAPMDTMPPSTNDGPSRYSPITPEFDLMKNFDFDDADIGSTSQSSSSIQPSTSSGNSNCSIASDSSMLSSTICDNVLETQSSFQKILDEIYEYDNNDLLKCITDSMQLS